MFKIQIKFLLFPTGCPFKIATNFLQGNFSGDILYFYYSYYEKSHRYDAIHVLSTKKILHPAKKTIKIILNTPFFSRASESGLQNKWMLDDEQAIRMDPFNMMMQMWSGTGL